MVQQEIVKLIKKSIKKLQKEGIFPKFTIPKYISIEHPERRECGDYSVIIALILGKKVKKNSTEIANLIKSRIKIQNSFFDKIEVVKPGFINFFLSKEYLISELKKILKEKNKYGSNKTEEGKTVIVDYSSPNIAKPFGIGHLRSTIIGQALYNIYKFLGWKCIGDNHLGDWGTQFGKLIVAIKEWGDEKNLKSLTIKDLEKLYVKFHQKAKSNPELLGQAQEWFKKLEQGDKEAKKIWQICIKISLKEFDKIYKLLGIKIDYALGESFYQGKMEAVIKDAEKRGIAQKSQGALVISLPDINIPLMILKRDGATTYGTRDLATIKHRIERWKPALIIYEVGVDQKFYFQQLFKAAELLGYAKYDEVKPSSPQTKRSAKEEDLSSSPRTLCFRYAKTCVGEETSSLLDASFSSKACVKEQFKHIAHGLIRFKGGKFSTRKGKTIHLEEVLKEAIIKAEKIIEKSETSKNFLLKEKEEVAKAVGIGAIKYNDLSRHYGRDIIFDWKSILSLEGNSGPYLQYTFARCQSVLKKADQKIDYQKIKTIDFNLEEEAILREIFIFPEIVQGAADSFSPHFICRFAFHLAQKYNLFYNLHPIISAPTQESKIFRLALTVAVAQILKNSLFLLGISTPEKM